MEFASIIIHRFNWLTSFKPSTWVVIDRAYTNILHEQKQFKLERDGERIGLDIR